MSRRKRLPRKYQFGGMMQTNPNDPNILSGALQGAGAGFKIGGPVGAGIGAVGGALPGLGQKAFEDSKFIRRIANKKAGRIALTAFSPLFGMGVNKAFKAQREQNRQERRNFENQLAVDTANSANILSTFPTQGIRGVSSFRYGGKMLSRGGRVMRGGGTIDLGNGMKLFTGNSHENGGIKLDIDSDGIQDAEVEGGEVLQGDRVYSDTLKPSDESLQEMENNFGFKFKNGGSFADIAKSLANRERSLHKKDTTRLAFKTKNLMLDRTRNALDYLFYDQELGKVLPDGLPVSPRGAQTFKMGGKIRRYQNGGSTDPEDENGDIQVAGGIEGPETPFFDEEGFLIDQPPIDEELDQETGETFNFIRTNPDGTRSRVTLSGNTRPGIFSNLGAEEQLIEEPTQLVPDSLRNAEPRVLPPAVRVRRNPRFNSRTRGVGRRRFFRNGGLINSIDPKTDDSLLSPFTIPETQFSTVDVPETVGGNNRSGINFGAIQEGLDSFNQSIPGGGISQGANLLNFIANRNLLNKVETEFTPRGVTARSVTPTNRLPQLLSANRRSRRQAFRDLQLSSGQSRARAAGSLLDRELQANNAAFLGEQAREDRISGVNAQLGQRADIINAQISNQAGLGNLNRRNELLANQLKARNAFTQGVLGNIQTDRAFDSDTAALLLNAYRQGDRGTVRRMLANNPELRQLLRLEN